MTWRRKESGYQQPWYLLYVACCYCWMWTDGHGWHWWLPKGRTNILEYLAGPCFIIKCRLAITESHCENKTTLRSSYRHLYIETALVLIPLYSCCNMPSQIAKFMGPTWGQPGSCRPQMCPMLAPWTLLSGVYCFVVVSNEHIFSHIPVNTCEHFDTLITLTCNKVI